jgi:very-short-patch-repair endonuclease
MNSRNIVGGQRVSPVKKELARELRQDMTLEEKILWHYLRGRNLAGFKFRRQQVIDGFIVDFYCHEAGLILEIDGGIHEKQKGYDVARDRIIASRGLVILRITNESIRNELYDTLAYIRKICKELVGN